MKRIKLVVSYDGTNYCGWQLQPRGISIEAVLNEKLSQLLGEEIMVIGASRTDSGVHALGNIAVFDTETRIPPEKICMALNQRLPEDIVIQSSCQVPLDWHPRKRNTRKTYEYKILNRRIPLPCLGRYSYFYYIPLDLEKMQQAAAALVGEHDFQSFCSSRSQAEDTVREIYELSVTKSEDLITIRICGNGFLYNMVRIIVGTLLRVGTGLYGPEQMKEILEARDRAKAGPKVPSEGLTLVAIEEEETLEPVVLRKNAHWDYKLIQREIVPKGQGYVMLNACDEQDYDRTVLRLTKRCVRNGARQVHLSDQTGRITDGKRFDYFTYRYEGEMCGLVRSRQPEDEKMVEGKLKLIPLSEELAETYQKIYERAFAEAPMGMTYDLEQVRGLLTEENTEAWLLYGEDDFVGFTEWKRKEDCMELEGVGILPEYRKKGYGRELLRHFLQEAADRGMMQTRLVCADFNQPAWKLYTELGYEKEKTFSSWYVTEDPRNPEG